METLSIHTIENAEKLCSYGDVRNNTKELSLDYCIDLRFDPRSNNLFVLAGSREGNIGIFSASMKGLKLCYTLNGGHTDIVRGVSWDLVIFID